ncbi:protein-tyrosine-phosphatase [Malassezia caprae]|uniref:Protein-tyrosine-phosphatase n=1 Tax=Malassezia caprae TaxID=1381934 RepID=A0AAF0IY33_9BASI|nr:protein-tyrosine-phosphatase [Malassezia caprae]
MGRSSAGGGGASLLGLLRKFVLAGYKGQLCWVTGGFVSYSRWPPAVDDIEWAPTQVDPTVASSSMSTGPMKQPNLHLGMPPHGPMLALPGSVGNSALHAANPFFDNIRQNLELSCGITDIVPLDLSLSKSDLGRLPRFLRDLAMMDDQARAKYLAERFFEIEKREQIRMQSVMQRHAFESSTNNSEHPPDVPISSRAIYPNTPTEHAVPPGSFPLSITAAIERGNDHRYRNFWTFEHSRVTLEKQPNQSKYINASFINPLRYMGGHDVYIATQAPLPSTFSVFWSVIWEYDIHTIVMLAREKEAGRTKCDNYWDELTAEPFQVSVLDQKTITSQDLQALCKPTETSDKASEMCVIQRTLQIRNLNVPDTPRHVTHYQYVAWPDHSVPDSPLDLLALNKILPDPTRIESSTMLPGADGSYVDMWVMDALHTLKSRIHPCLTGKPLLDSPPVPTLGEEALEHMSVLLHECDDLLEFEQAERACGESMDVTPTREVQNIDNCMFNYKLAVEAVRVLQRERSAQMDPDETVVGDWEPKISNMTEEERSKLERAHLEALETMKTAHAQELARMVEEHRLSNEDLFTSHAAELAQAYSGRTKEMEDLRLEHEATLAMTSKMYEERLTHNHLAQNEAASRHAAEVRLHNSAHTDTLQATLQLGAAMEELGATLVQNATQLATMQQRMDTYEAYVLKLEKQHGDALEAHGSLRTAHHTLSSEHELAARRLAELEASLAERDEAIAHTQRQLGQVQGALEQRESDLFAKSSRLTDAESQVAELQSELERSSQVQTNVDQILHQLTASEAQVTELQKQLKSLELVKAERAQWAGEMHELQKMLSMYKTSASHAEQEQERAKEQMEKLQAEFFVMEQALADREADIRALKESKRRYVEQIRTERAEHAAKRDADQNTASLTQRVADLELELSAKASEIEEADTRMLLVMKENKRLAAQVKALRNETKRALQDVTNNQASNVSPDKHDASLPNRLARLRPVS